MVLEIVLAMVVHNKTSIIMVGLAASTMSLTNKGHLAAPSLPKQ